MGGVDWGGGGRGGDKADTRRGACDRDKTPSPLPALAVCSAVCSGKSAGIARHYSGLAANRSVMGAVDLCLLCMCLIGVSMIRAWHI